MCPTCFKETSTDDRSAYKEVYRRRSSPTEDKPDKPAASREQEQEQEECPLCYAGSGKPKGHKGRHVLEKKKEKPPGTNF